MRETGKKYHDGSHVIFVNGKYKGDDEVGRLMHDFNCRTSKDMYYKPLADGVRHFKETEKGRENMCDAVKEYAKKYADGEKENYIRKMLSKGYAKEEIADIINVSVTEVKAVAEGKALVLYV